MDIQALLELVVTLGQATAATQEHLELVDTQATVAIRELADIQVQDIQGIADIQALLELVVTLAKVVILDTADIREPLDTADIREPQALVGIRE